MEEASSRADAGAIASTQKKHFLIFFIDYLFLRNRVHELYIFCNLNCKGITRDVFEVLGVFLEKKTLNTSKKIFGNFRIIKMQAAAVENILNRVENGK